MPDLLECFWAFQSVAIFSSALQDASGQVETSTMLL